MATRLFDRFTVPNCVGRKPPLAGCHFNANRKFKAAVT